MATLMVGHTHNSLDRCFSRLSVALKGCVFANDVFSTIGEPSPHESKDDPPKRSDAVPPPHSSAGRSEEGSDRRGHFKKH